MEKIWRTTKLANNLGKKFEQKFKEDFLKIENSTIDRLVDVMNGYKYISNISDFIGYVYPNIYYLECKSHKGNTFPIANLTQYEKLLEKQGIHGVRTGVILWFIEHDRVLYVPIKTFTKLIIDKKKSFNINTAKEEGYEFIEIPSVKKRVFMESDYSVLKDLEEGW